MLHFLILICVGTRSQPSGVTRPTRTRSPDFHTTRGTVIRQHHRGAFGGLAGLVHCDVWDLRCHRLSCRSPVSPAGRRGDSYDNASAQYVNGRNTCPLSPGSRAPSAPPIRTSPVILDSTGIGGGRDRRIVIGNEALGGASHEMDHGDRAESARLNARGMHQGPRRAPSKSGCSTATYRRRSSLHGRASGS